MGEVPHPDLVETLSRRAIWLASGRDAPASAPAASMGREVDEMTLAWLERAGSDSMRAEQAMAEEGAVWEERDMLLRALLETLPASALARIAERVLGRTVDAVAQLDTTQVSIAHERDSLVAPPWRLRAICASSDCLALDVPWRSCERSGRRRRCGLRASRDGIRSRLTARRPLR